MSAGDAGPRPKAIRTILGRAGFVRSDTRGVVSTVGFHVVECVGEAGVTVRFWPEPGEPPNLADNRAVLVRYAEVIADAGYEVDLRRHELVVTHRGVGPGGDSE